MTDLFTKQAITIEPGEAVSGIAREPRILHVRSGRVWLTVNGNSGDFWLHAGDSFAIPPSRLTVIEADQGASRMDLIAAGRPSFLRELGMQVVQRVRHLAGTRKTGRAAAAQGQACHL
ncbi:DUF2917 domain-containing protein [Noviherbaspirillum massiliense]|uniref:DUF2917 domain-containing protein n=1 Tax=Noviherbaspirillum massiliense TaxID=1465823 RepID=UPI0002D70079|nr:DUF2917 domain-containing protein [Noviherbaspirillum massiliense]